VGRKDHDAKARINRARVSGKDGQAGRLLRQLGGRLEQATRDLSSRYVNKQRRLGMEMRGEKSQRDLLFRLDGGEISLGQRRLAFDDLEMTPHDRVALTGPNGAGKSTLLRHIVDQLPLDPQRVVYMAQEINRHQAADILSQVRALPRSQLGAVMSAVSCLGSDPVRLMETAQPSPGELRKIMLALGMAHQPHLIIMDEPTNHLDLPSIECLESALGSSHAALLLVSHDLRFLRRLTRWRWDIRSRDNLMRLHVIDGWPER